MLNQMIGSLSILINYIPTIITLSLNIVILIFAIFILKKNSYKYGLFLMISSIFLIISDVIYIAVGYPDLFYRLYYELGFDSATVTMITFSISMIFFILNLTGAVFLFIAVYLIFKTHRNA